MWCNTKSTIETKKKLKTEKAPFFFSETNEEIKRIGIARDVAVSRREIVIF